MLRSWARRDYFRVGGENQIKTGLFGMEKKQKKSGNKFIILDLFFYAAIPYVLWKFGRDPLGDYVANADLNNSGIHLHCLPVFKRKAIQYYRIVCDRFTSHWDFG